MIGVLKIVLMGRPNGLRRKILSRFLSEPEDTSPNSSFSAPVEQENTERPIVESSLEPPRDVTPPEGYEVILHKGALDDGELKEVIIAGTSIAVAQKKGVVYAFSNTFSHDVGTGGPLTEGALLIGDDYFRVRSPYLGWDFDIQTGECLTSSEVTLECYPTHIEGDAICVKV